MGIRGWIENQRGAAAVTAIIVMVVLGLLGAAYIALSTTEMGISSSYRNGVAAQYLAEAGALWARVQLKQSSAFRSETNIYPGKTYPAVSKNTGATAGTYTVTVGRNPNEQSNSQKRQIVSTGTVGKAKRQVVVLIELGSENKFLPSDVADLFKQYSYASGSNMVVDNNANICGNIRSNGEINLDNNANIGGNVTAAGKVNNKKATVGGAISSNAPALTIPELNAANYQSGTKIDTNFIIQNNGSYTLNGGIYYINGDLTLNNNSQLLGDGIVYVTGNINLQNNVEVSGKVFLISANSINVDNNVVLRNALLYAKQNITIRNNAMLNGAAIARNGVVNADNNSNQTCNPTIVDFFTSMGTGGGGVTDWDNKVVTN